MKDKHLNHFVVFTSSFEIFSCEFLEKIVGVLVHDEINY